MSDVCERCFNCDNKEICEGYPDGYPSIYCEDLEIDDIALLYECDVCHIPWRNKAMALACCNSPYPDEITLVENK